MNQAEVAETIKKLFLPFIILVILLAVGIWWFYLREPTVEAAFGELAAPKIKSTIVSTAKISNLVSIENAPHLPRVVDIYERYPVVKEETIVSQLGFGGEPEIISGQKIWQEGTRSLKFTINGLGFSFIDSTEINGGKLTGEEAISQAESLLRSLGILSLTKSKSELIVSPVSYLRAEKTEANEVESNQDFNIYSLGFGLKIDSFSLVDESGNGELINVWIGRDGTLKKIEGPIQPLITETSSTYKVKSLKDAQKELEAGKGVIVNTSGPIDLSGQIEILYTKVQLAYFLSPKDERYFQPVYVFQGISTSQEGNVQVTALLPAVKF